MRRSGRGRLVERAAQVVRATVFRGELDAVRVNLVVVATGGKRGILVRFP